MKNWWLAIQTKLAYAPFSHHINPIPSKYFDTKKNFAKECIVLKNTYFVSNNVGKLENTQIV